MAHELCDHFNLSGITSMLKNRVEDHQKFASSLFSIENSLIEELRESREAISQQFCLGDL